ncbi:MAG: glycosyl transferase [Bacteroidetes bacterium]|nr:MAG: glycosyl transferase [Bacteroidota bacterium]
MKLLYGIQGTGNGHLSRARDLIPRLQAFGTVDVLVSGTQSQLDLPYPIRYRCKGFSFLYNRRGGINYARSGWHNLSLQLYREIRDLPVDQYDLVINDFEPVSAWAARWRGVPVVALGHQASFLSPHSPRPETRSAFGEAVLRHYAPASRGVGFHFEAYDDFIFPPVIRGDIRTAAVTDEGHYLVYLPAFHEKRLLALLEQIPEVRWEVFSKHSRETWQQGHIRVQSVSAKAFTERLLSCRGILTGAGFETPAEALYLGKKLFVVPIRGQYEQHCNAAALARLGVPVSWRPGPEFLPRLQAWVRETEAIQIDFPDRTEAALARALLRDTVLSS